MQFPTVHYFGAAAFVVEILKCQPSYFNRLSPRLAGTPQTSIVNGTSIAVIVNAENPADQLSVTELQRIVLGERRNWSGTIPIVLMMRNQESPNALSCCRRSVT
jgi:hypothetical protein